MSRYPHFDRIGLSASANSVAGGAWVPRWWLIRRAAVPPPECRPECQPVLTSQQQQSSAERGVLLWLVEKAAERGEEEKEQEKEKEEEEKQEGMGIKETEEGGMRVLQPSQRAGLLSAVALLVWLGGIHLNFLVFFVAVAYLPSALGWAMLALLVLLTVAPIAPEWEPGQRVARFISDYAPAHFPIKVVMEDRAAFDPSRAYVIAAEPHSVLPIGIVVLTAHSGFLPFTNIRCLASSAIFYTPVVRHVWSWLGLVPATKSHFRRLLAAGTSCIIVPGGVRECLYMERGYEVLYLKQRFGFVRFAIETGAPLVPAFCFGQSSVYRWWKPSGALYDKVSRAIGFTPLMFWGILGTPIPYRSPMYFVVGKPIPVEKVASPSRDQVAAVHQQYLEAIRQLFDKYKATAGHQDTQLHIY